MKYLELMELAASYITAEKPTINQPEDIFKLVLPLLQDCIVEKAVALYLDSKNHVISLNECSSGTANSCMIHAREFYRGAILDNAVGAIFIHNHPSGNPTPSEQDKAISKSLYQAGKILGIPLYDSVIIGKKTESCQGFFSFRENNLLF